MHISNKILHTPFYTREIRVNAITAAELLTSKAIGPQTTYLAGDRI